MKYVESEKEAKDFIKEITSKYSDARHNCYAYVISGKEKYFDDGEPKGTAGMPMLSVLHQKELNNIVVIVTRYFGGIKLGGGGLIRAYRTSVLEALEEVELLEDISYSTLSFEIDPLQLPQYENFLRTNNLEFNIEENILTIKVEEQVAEEINNKFIEFRNKKGI
jgi:uncharacterized YigZ family protein